MSTRAIIALKLEDNNQYISTYQHWDGYLHGLGWNLFQHWQNYELTLEAIKLGDSSHWGTHIGRKLNFEDRDHPEHYRQNIYYGRDRGEKNTGPRYHNSLEDLYKSCEDLWIEFLYVGFKESQSKHQPSENLLWKYTETEFDMPFEGLKELRIPAMTAMFDHLDYILKDS